MRTAKGLLYLLPLLAFLIYVGVAQPWDVALVVCGGAAIAVLVTHWEAGRLRAYDEEMIVKYESDLDTYDELTLKILDSSLLAENDITPAFQLQIMQLASHRQQSRL